MMFCGGHNEILVGCVSQKCVEFTQSKLAHVLDVIGKSK
jgi:hypothetical protein